MALHKLDTLKYAAFTSTLQSPLARGENTNIQGLNILLRDSFLESVDLSSGIW